MPGMNGFNRLQHVIGEYEGGTAQVLIELLQGGCPDDGGTDERPAVDIGHRRRREAMSARQFDIGDAISSWIAWLAQFVAHGCAPFLLHRSESTRPMISSPMTMMVVRQQAIML
jgi:hypothetical protein